MKFYMQGSEEMILTTHYSTSRLVKSLSIKGLSGLSQLGYQVRVFNILFDSIHYLILILIFDILIDMIRLNFTS
jgi:hypothetical protein